MSTALQLRERLGNIKAKAKEQSAKVVRAGVGAGSAFGIAYAEGRWGDSTKVFDMDLSLVVGVAASALGAYGIADKTTNELLESAGIGALCVYASKQGTEKGIAAKNAK